MRQYAAAGISHVQLVLDPITVEAIEEFAPVLLRSWTAADRYRC